MEESGTREVAEKMGVPVVDLNTDEHEEVEVPSLCNEISQDRPDRPGKQCHHKRPVMKTHIRSAVTVSLRT